jgi:hypothetical protein
LSLLRGRCPARQDLPGAEARLLDPSDRAKCRRRFYLQFLTMLRSNGSRYIVRTKHRRCSWGDLMGKFDKEIAQALKIGKGWKETAEGYAGTFQTLKKEHLALEKGAIKRVQDAVQANQPNLAAHLEPLSHTKELLEQFKKEGVKEFDALNKWALGEPRQNMGHIGPKVGFRDPNSEGYKAVAAGIKNQLTEVSTAVSAAQKAWKGDLAIAIDNHLDKVEALEKIINQETSKTAGFLDQFRKAIARYKDDATNTYNALKLDQFVQDITNINSGAMATKDKTIIQQRYHLATERLAKMPALIALLEKNYGRVVKSIPDKTLNGLSAKSDKEQLEKIHANITKDMTHATSVFDAAKKAFESKKLV